MDGRDGSQYAYPYTQATEQMMKMAFVSCCACRSKHMDMRIQILNPFFFFVGLLEDVFLFVLMNY